MFVDVERRGNLRATAVEMDEPCVLLGDDERSNKEPVGLRKEDASVDSQHGSSRSRMQDTHRA